LEKICLSIAEENIKKLEESIKRALQLKPDLLEIRFDYLPVNDIHNAINAVDLIKDKCIFTLRSASQGGRYVGNEDERVNHLKLLSNQNPFLLDVEFETIQNYPGLYDFFRKSDSRLLISWHNFNNTPDSLVIENLITNINQFSNFVKIVTMALTGMDSIRLLRLYELFPKINLVLFAMGDAGIVSRILCTIVGHAPFTYATMNESLAPGQMNIVEMRRIYNKIHEGVLRKRHG